MRRIVVAACVCVALASPAGAQGGGAASADSARPLGTMSNPVLASSPSAQQEYIARLRCPDGTKPVPRSRGSKLNGAPDGHVTDTYVLQCGTGGPTHTVVMDMYHRDAGREMRPVAPFTVLAEHPARLAAGCPPRVLSDSDSSARYVFSWYEVERPVRWLNRVDSVGTGPRMVFLSLTFVVDTAGAADLATLIVNARADSAANALAREALSAFTFAPAEHHAGCRVRQSAGISLRVKTHEP